MSLDNALRITLGLEGGYSNDPLDHGGATNYGVTQDTYNGYRQFHRLVVQPVKLITKDEVREIYESDYWREGRCHIITNTRPKLATIHFDCCVNCGTTQAAKLLQRAVGALDDGVIGSKTLAAINARPDESASKDYLNQRVIFYTKLIINNPSQSKFESSWFHRLDKLSKELNLGWTR